jgi:fructose 1,6-bisphosphatase
MSKISDEWKRQYNELNGIIETEELGYAVQNGYIAEDKFDDPKLKQAIEEARFALDYIERCAYIGERWSEENGVGE